MSTDNTTLDIAGLCKRFRSAIDTAVTNGEFSDDKYLLRFPRGCCDEACDLLHLFLVENGYESVSVRGECDALDSEGVYPHVWLVLENGDIADITGDQFSDGRVQVRCVDPCYVGPLDAFHEQFGDIQALPGPEEYSEEALGRIARRYNKVLKYLS